jgi:hypothetical protein
MTTGKAQLEGTWGTVRSDSGLVVIPIGRAAAHGFFSENLARGHEPKESLNCQLSFICRMGSILPSGYAWGAPTCDGEARRRDLHAACVSTKTTHGFCLDRSHPKKVLRVGKICIQLRQLSLEMRKLARFLRGHRAQARCAGVGSMHSRHDVLRDRVAMEQG